MAVPHLTTSWSEDTLSIGNTIENIYFYIILYTEQFVFAETVGLHLLNQSAATIHSSI